MKPNADSPDVSWEAYWLPISQPGRPHILEVEYPSDVPQTLGISILEPNAAGALAPLGVDSGVDNARGGDRLGATPRWQRHRLIFWPRTTTPLLLITNGRDRTPAVYGKIRVLAGGRAAAAALPDRAAANRRLLAAYLDRPLIPENFSADECLDPWSGRSLDDWWTFYEGGTRLVEYLNHAGYNGLMLGVLADGSTIYPSALLQPTPRYDTGAFFASAQDPVRKDVLEMLLRLFDREDLQLIPDGRVRRAAARVGGAPPRRRARRRGHRVDRRRRDQPVRLAAAAARTGALLQRARSARAAGDARRAAGVGRALRAASVVDRRGRAAVGRRLCPTARPRLGTGRRDDRPLRAATRSCTCPATGRSASPQRSAFLAQEPQRRAWLEWRAAQLAKFYRRAYDELAAIRPGSRLYLAGAGMIGGPELERELRPTLPRRTTIAAALLRVGIDARHYRDDQQRIVLLRPERIAPQTKPRRPRRRPRNRPDGRHRPLLPDRRAPRAVCSSTRRAKSTSNRSTTRAPSSRATRGWSPSRRLRASRTGGASSTAWPRSTRR